MSFLNTLSLLDTAFCLALGLAGYIVALLIYRLWLSPLSGFPGSPFAKTTFWYEFYYDWVKPGQYYRRIHEMHQIYGKHTKPSPKT
jgi:hypothetical protein